MNWSNIDFEIDLVNELFALGEMTQSEYEERVFKIFEKEIEKDKEYNEKKN